MVRVEFFFDLSSPWTCLAFNNIQPIIKETGAEIIWRPFLVGGVFNAVNKGVYNARADMDSPKVPFMLKSVRDWAAWSGVKMNFPAPHHPVKSVNAMRMCVALEDDQEKLFNFADSTFAAYFGEQSNIDDPAVLLQIANDIGLDGDALQALSVSDNVKGKLRTNTQEVIDRGGFGSPTIFVNGDDMYFGNDQLPLVKRAILAAK